MDFNRACRSFEEKNEGVGHRKHEVFVCFIKEGYNIWIKWSVSILIHLNLLLICLVQDTQVHSVKSSLFAHGQSVPGTFFWASYLSSHCAIKCLCLGLIECLAKVLLLHSSSWNECEECECECEMNVKCEKKNTLRILLYSDYLVYFLTLRVMYAIQKISSHYVTLPTV